MFKKYDFIIIAVLMIFSFLPEVIFSINVGKNFNKVYAEISVEGKVVETVNLTGHVGKDELDFEIKNGYNKVVISEEKIGMLDADCSDKVCMYPEYISKPGEMLVCLPHKFMIEVKGQKSDEEEDIIISH